MKLFIYTLSLRKKAEKQKILILSNNGSGLYAFRRELIIKLLKENEVLLALPFDDWIEELKGLGCRLIQTKLERRGLNPIKDMALIWRYKQIIHEEKPDIIITYTIKPNIYGGVISRLTGHAYAVNITGLGTAFEKDNLLRQSIMIMYRIALKKARVVFFENSANRDLFIEEGIIRREQSCLLNGAGVNLDWFALQPYPNNEVFRFLFMGRIMKEKGVDELFSAMRQLNREGYNCHLDLLGGFEEYYGQQIRTYEKEGWLTYHGIKKDVRPFITQSDCFVLPSWHEGMANTNLECAATGRPIITSNISGCKEAVIEGISGMLCEPQNINSLFVTMRKMIQTSKDERAKMGIAGRKHIEDHFDKIKVVDKTIENLICS